MRPFMRTGELALVLLVAVGCGDSGGKQDAGKGADLGPTRDARSGDRGTADAGAGDAGKDQGIADASGPSCAASFASCTAFEDKTATSAVIEFGGAAGSAYSPNCIKVKIGQSVTFKGNFETHPLNQACGPDKVIKKTVSTGTSSSFSFPREGIFGYYCGFHGQATGAGMAGAIQVVK
ncbi:MAG: hypothetical protein IT371_24945 [Deltaproteobacteria bacterium]|nr:hypothetical protein [Deltaproteobacteria bacterium]